MTKDELLNEIHDVFYFKSTFMINDIACVRDEYSSEEYEGNMVASFFSGKSNSDLNFSDFMTEYPGDNTACISFMKPASAAYFLGFYMYAAIYEDLNGLDFRFQLMNYFGGDFFDDPDFEEWVYEIRENLPHKGKKVVFDFISYVEENHKDELIVIDFSKAKSRFS